mmetsp:Transcript_11037/g.18857  ORF Transcript_11037/g.18857 Transcript_11037/m.18857 type:complete len:274 (-) Transcript_11037:834-1655(-)
MHKGATVSVHAEAAVGVLGEADICGSTAGRSMGEMGSVGDSPSRGRRGDCGSPNALMVWLLYPLPLAPPAHGGDQLCSARSLSCGGSGFRFSVNSSCFTTTPSFLLLPCTTGGLGDEGGMGYGIIGGMEGGTKVAQRWHEGGTIWHEGGMGGGNSSLSAMGYGIIGGVAACSWEAILSSSRADFRTLVGVPERACELQNPLLVTLLWQPSSSQRFPPPCLTHKSVGPWVDLVQPSLCWQRLPPPCDTENFVAPTMCLTQMAGECRHRRLVPPP